MRPYKPRVVYAYDKPMGGYALHLMRLILGIGARWFVFTLPIAKTQEERDIAVSYLTGTNHRAFDSEGKPYVFTGHAVQYAYRDDDKYVYVVVAGMNGWLSFLRDNGFFVKAMGKVVKRLKAFNRPTLLGAEFPYLDIEIVENTAFVDPDFHDKLTALLAEIPEDVRPTREEAEAMLLDGWIAGHPKMFGALVEQSEFHDDFLRHKLQLLRANNSSQYNVRITDGEGFIKGNITVGRGMTADLRMARSAIKDEILSEHHTLVIAEPQPGKDSVRMNRQYQDHMPKLFRQSDLHEWMKDAVSSWKKDIIEGRSFYTFGDVESMRWDAMKKAGNWAEGIAALAKYSAIEWKMRGGDLRKSPWMVERMARSMVENLIDNRGNVRIPIPCAFHEQMISQSAARMAGHDVTVPEGYYYRLTSIGVTVVNDIDWIRNYPNWGTPDFDDFFDGIERTMDGVQGAFFMRPPNELGGWVFLKHIEGQPFSKWRKADGKVISFPEVNGKGWPKQITERLKDGSLRYTGLPSDKRDKPVYNGEEYSPEFFIADVDDSINSGSVGAYINARGLYTQTFFTEKDSTFVCSLNDAVDVFVQAGAADDRLIISAEADVLTDKVVKSGRPIDRHTWESRHAMFYRGDDPVNLYDGPPTKAYNLVKGYADEFVKWAINWGQAHAEAPSLLIHTLGGYQASLTPRAQHKVWDTARNANYQQAIKLVEAHRFAIGKANTAMQAMDLMAEELGLSSGDGRLGSNVWAELYAPIIEAVTSREGKDRHDLVLSLISVCYIKRTKTTQRISDAMVFNNQRAEDGTPEGLFPYVVDALRYYGFLADELTFDDHEKVLEQKFIKSWDLACSVCGTVYTINNAVEYQKYTFTNLVCKNCKPTS